MEEEKKPQEVENQKVDLTPSEYFDKLKNAKQTITDEKLRNSYDTILRLAEKYKKTGQKKSLEKLLFLARTINEEEKLISLGITTFIYRDVIEDYIDHVANDVVKIIELSNYMREIPDEIADAVEKTKDIFDEFYVVFTDYTGRQERQVAQERRDRDPILFGCFKNRNYVADRFYFIGDWVDEHCDLTLDKLVEQYKAKKDGMDPRAHVVAPQTSEELLELLDAYKEKEVKANATVNPDRIFAYTNIDVVANSQPKKPRFFDKIRSIFGHSK